MRYAFSCDVTRDRGIGYFFQICSIVVNIVLFYHVPRFSLLFVFSHQFSVFT
jgi:hypothetical protein